MQAAFCLFESHAPELANDILACKPGSPDKMNERLVREGWDFGPELLGMGRKGVALRATNQCPLCCREQPCPNPVAPCLTRGLAWLCAASPSRACPGPIEPRSPSPLGEPKALRSNNGWDGGTTPASCHHPRPLPAGEGRFKLIGTGSKPNPAASSARRVR